MSYALWRAELKHSTPEDRRLDRTTTPSEMLGFWRMENAKSKPDWPVAIWQQDGRVGLVTFFSVGAGEKDGESLFNDAEHPDRVTEFCNSTWLKCVAVVEADYHQAMKTKYWPAPAGTEPKKSRHLTTEEEAGLPTDGNAPKDVALDLQIEELADKIDKAPAETQEEANALSGMLDRMRSLLGLAEAERVREKQPFLDGGRAVDAKFRDITQPGTAAYDAGEKRRKAFLKKEQARLAAETAAENKRRQEEAARAAEEERKRVAEETAARLAAEAEQRGEEVAPEEIEAVAQAEAEQLVQEPIVEEVQAPRATAGSAYGRSTGLRKVTRAKITDMAKLLVALKDHKEMKEFAQTLANRAAKAGISLDGMEIEETME